MSNDLPIVNCLKDLNCSSRSEMSWPTMRPTTNERASARAIRCARLPITKTSSASQSTDVRPSGISMLPVGPVNALGSLAKKIGRSGMSKPASRRWRWKLIPAPRILVGRGTGSRKAAASTSTAALTRFVAAMAATFRSDSMGQVQTPLKSALQVGENGPIERRGATANVG